LIETEREQNVMIVYAVEYLNHLFDEIDISKLKDFLDFGRGFHTIVTGKYQK